MWDPARKVLGAAAVILDEQGRSMDRGGHSGVVVAAQLVAVFLAMVACGPAPVTPEPAADPTVVLPAAPTAVGATASPSQLMAPRSRTAGYDTAKIRRWAARPGEWSPPELLQLVRVLPIAQSVAHDGVELTALSLEAYTDGFLVNLRLLTAAAQPRTPESHAFPDLDLHATDDRGGRYEVWPDGGSGSGRQWRYTHLFTPALDPAARELRLEAPEVRWLCMGPEGLDKAETQPGPWRFVVTLPVEGHRGP